MEEPQPHLSRIGRCDGGTVGVIMSGNYPAGVSDNDPEFDMPSVGDDEYDEFEAAQIGYMQRLQASGIRYHKVEENEDEH
jgi:hypothetical protein